MTSSRYRRALDVACVLALLGIGFMLWSLLDPRPAPVVLAMSVGQAFGALSLLIFLVVVASDLRAKR